MFSILIWQHSNDQPSVRFQLNWFVQKNTLTIKMSRY